MAWRHAHNCSQRSPPRRVQPSARQPPPCPNSRTLTRAICILARAHLRTVLSFAHHQASKSESGVLVITVITSPYPHGQRFSCAYVSGCCALPDQKWMLFQLTHHFTHHSFAHCLLQVRLPLLPQRAGAAALVPARRAGCAARQPGAPKENEKKTAFEMVAGFLPNCVTVTCHVLPFATQNSFDPVLQFVDRAAALQALGHPVDKVSSHPALPCLLLMGRAGVVHGERCRAPL